MHYPTWQARRWLLGSLASNIWRVLLVGGPPLLPVPLTVLGAWSSDSIEMPGPIPGHLTIWFPGLAWMLVMPVALVNLILAAFVGWRPEVLERMTLQSWMRSCVR